MVFLKIKRPLIFFLTFLFTFLLILNLNSLGDASENNLIVIGVVNGLSDERWKDYRIGFGVRTLITQALFNTGQFNILEEKQEIKEKIKELSRGIWESSKKKYKLSRDIETVKSMGVDFVAFGRIFYFGKPQTDISVGIMHRRVIETVIKIEITIENIRSGKKISSKGMGKAKTEASSILFSIREDNVIFDETSIGIATRNAVEDAIEKLMKKLPKIQ